MGLPRRERASTHSSCPLLCPADLRSPRSLWWGTCRWGRLVSLIGKRVLELSWVGLGRVGLGLARWVGLRATASGTPLGSAKTPLIRITRPPLEWTLRWNDLRCWASPSVCSCKCFLHPFQPFLPPAPKPHLLPTPIPVFHPPFLPAGIPLDRRGSNALPQRTTEELKVRGWVK